MIPLVFSFILGAMTPLAYMGTMILLGIGVKEHGDMAAFVIGSFLSLLGVIFWGMRA